MNSNAAVTATSYAGQLAIIGMWMDGAIESGSWHVTYEVMTVAVTLSIQAAHNLAPLWRATVKKIFGYDPYANGEAKP